MNFKSPVNSPFSKMKECSSMQAINISGYPIGNGHKSPCTRDRFVGTYKSPKRCSSVNENIMQDLDGCNMTLGGSTMGTPKKAYKRPQATPKLLDAPDISTDFPEKLIDINQNNNSLAVALGSSIYIYKDNDVNVLMEGNTQINGVCWVGDDLAISGDGHIELWDVNQKTVFQSFRDHHNRAVAMSTYGNRFATGGADGIIYLYDLRVQNCQRMNAHPNCEVCALSWSLDGNTLASSGTDNYVNIIGRKNMRYRHNAPVQSLAWMNSGILITGERGDDGAIHSFHTRSDDPEKVTYSGSPVTGIAMTEQWGLIVSHFDSKGTWDIWSPDLSKKVTDFQGHRSGILNMCANADGSFVATISADESLCIWDLKPSVLTPIQSPRFVPNHYSPGYRNTPTSRLSPYQAGCKNNSGYLNVR